MAAERPNFDITPIIDIDDTISEGIFLLYLRAYNEILGLGISEEDMERHRLDPAIKTFDVPEVKAWLEQGQEYVDRFNVVFESICHSDEIHRHELTPIEGAQEGVERIHDMFGDVSYYTVRPTQVEDATGWWLRKHGFPNPDRVTICKTPQDKLFKIVMTHVVEHGSNGINVPTGVRTALWDDGFPKLIVAADTFAGRRLITGKQLITGRALKGLATVAFGAEKERAHNSPNLLIVNQPTWRKPSLDGAVSELSKLAA